jgi:alpha-tubulin suppressor-like RCC1 family protein
MGRSTFLVLACALAACDSAHPRLAAIGDVLFVACGGPATAAVKLKNDGDAPLHFTATSSSEPIFRVDAATGTIAPHGEKVLVVTATPPSGQPGDGYTGLLLVDSDDLDHPSVRVPLRLDLNAGRIAADPNELDFGDLPLGASAKLGFGVTNAGNRTAGIQFPSVTDFAFSWEVGTSSVTLAPSDRASATASFTPSAVGDRGTDWSFAAASGVLCPSAGPHLRARGVSGVVGVTPGSMDFGSIACGSGGGVSRSFSILNVSKQPFHFQASLAKGFDSLFAVVPDAGLVPPEGKIDVTVTFDGIPETSPVDPDHWGDTVMVSTDAPNDSPHAVALHVTAKGAILAWTTMLPLDFQRVQINRKASDGVSVENQGNADAEIALSVAINDFAVPATLLIGAGKSVGIPIDLMPHPQSLGVAVKDALTAMPSKGILCAPLPQPAPLQFVPFDRAFTAAASDVHMCASSLGTAGLVYCWGANGFGQLGDGSTVDHAQPAPINKLLGNSSVYRLFVGPQFSCAMDNLNTLRCWGRTLYGDSATPIVFGNQDLNISYDLFSYGMHHACAVYNGSVSCFGHNASGEVGDGTTTDRYNPVGVAGLSGVARVKVSSGLSNASCAVKNDGSVACWGSNAWGELAQPFNTPFSTTPLIVAGIIDATDVVGGERGFCVLRSGSTRVSCWGDNTGSKLGVDPPPYQSATPVDVSNVGNPNGLFHGADHACVFESGNMSCWGSNVFGELLGMSSSSKVPLAISVSNVSFASAVEHRTVVVLANGTIRWWGKGNQKMVPETVAGLD